MVALPDNFGQIDASYAATSAELQYRVRFATAGTYYVWLRVFGPGGPATRSMSGWTGRPCRAPPGSRRPPGARGPGCLDDGRPRSP